MDYKIKWSHEAATDLDAIAGYIAKDSVYYASSFVEELLDAANSLALFAERGRVVPEFNNLKIRELFVREYRLIYFIDKDCVFILGIIHGKRNLKYFWKKEKRKKN